MKKTLLSLTAAATAFSFSSCANPYGPHATNAQRNAATGAIIGGAAGALIGKQSGRTLEGAAIGAGIGGVAGHMHGKNQDAQQQGYYR